MDAIRYQIGDGTSEIWVFWHHPWLTNGPLSRRVDYSVRFISRIPEAARVSDLIGNQRWVLPTARNAFLEDIWQEIREFLIPPVPLPDRVVWTLSTEGDFSFKSAWQLVRYQR